ncbi:MAG: hypothetical protein PF447_03050 [Spirochaetaceae bacterium]|jgi:hypothetical protein|nr:hypothetical protein [Spirochaetaceae bacterium]
MAIHYDSVVPWGRAFEEYIDMFSLTEEDLKKRILGCGDGPANFNNELTKRGGFIQSVDPIYQYSKGEIENRIEETFPIVIKQTQKNKDLFVWGKIKDIDYLVNIRKNAMDSFLNDFEQGKIQGRYIYGELPDLPKLKSKFDLALCSHLFFLYSDNLSYSFHEKSIDSILKIAHEIRIFPLLDLSGRRSVYVDKIIEKYSDENHLVEEFTVDYEFIKRGNKMLSIKTIP